MWVSLMPTDWRLYDNSTLCPPSSLAQSSSVRGNTEVLLKTNSTKSTKRWKLK